MDRTPNTQDTSSFSYQVDLLQLNLHLAEAEKPSFPQAQAHASAVAELRTLRSRV